MELLLPLLAFVGVLGMDPEPEPSRQGQLYVVLERAVMLRDASPSRATHAPGPEQDMALDLMHMELASGYLDRTCVCDDETVTRMRMMIAWIGLQRFMGESDQAIEARLVASAGDEAGRVRQFLGFAGLDGIDHFICADFMGEALDAGMPAAELRTYIDEMAPPPTSGGVRLAASR